MGDSPPSHASFVGGSSGTRRSSDGTPQPLTVPLNGVAGAHTLLTNEPTLGETPQQKLVSETGDVRIDSHFAALASTRRHK